MIASVPGTSTKELPFASAPSPANRDAALGAGCDTRIDPELFKRRGTSRSLSGVAAGIEQSEPTPEPIRKTQTVLAAIPAIKGLPSSRCWRAFRDRIRSPAVPVNPKPKQ